MGGARGCDTHGVQHSLNGCVVLVDVQTTGCDGWCEGLRCWPGTMCSTKCCVALIHAALPMFLDACLQAVAGHGKRALVAGAHVGLFPWKGSAMDLPAYTCATIGANSLCASWPWRLTGRSRPSAQVLQRRLGG